jgi:hypothetical protein
MSQVITIKNLIDICKEANAKGLLIEPPPIYSMVFPVIGWLVRSNASHDILVN